MNKSFVFIIFAALALCSCTGRGFSRVEKAVIGGEGPVLRVLTVENPEDSLFLRRKAADLPVGALKSEEYRTLAQKLIATVTSPEQDGVGLAGPQIGISRRIVAVQRFDKFGEPFEVYPNIRIVDRIGEMVPGREGCLSVPGRNGIVPRYREVKITYSRVVSDGSGVSVRDTTETIIGFTAVIFQHECDHLDGVLYTDYL